MSRKIEQIKDILHGSHGWNSGLEEYDFILSIEFRQDGTGEMVYGECQAVKSIIHFRYDISADMQIHFEFFDTVDPYWTPFWGGKKMFERTEENALKMVAFHLLDGPFFIDKPFDSQQSIYSYLLRFASDPFPDSSGPWPLKETWLDYYGGERK
ncbi:hypothetical protein [Dictyobacter arantiisoli]|uniref:Uncharacterized protein n=1 Tax=Dictyobacter arantiisoli TaxID=2014874 RepID=A0A5A5T750_9CHLR|nr:hypothetical protein [Dictyobacter arantiisoli]GCF07300.1 hypothetical protein KDI_08640 [Dictyobacter arantiisoli]